MKGAATFIDKRHSIVTTPLPLPPPLFISLSYSFLGLFHFLKNSIFFFPFLLCSLFSIKLVLLENSRLLSTVTRMERMHIISFSLLALLLMLPSTNPLPIPKSRTLYEIACTMCSSCCNPVPSPPPPPSPSPPPPSSTYNCPPPPSPPTSSGSYYYSPLPPSTYTYSSPPPPQGGGGGGGHSYYYYPPPNYKNYPTPPPPNPIVPYFPFYYYSPPSMSGCVKLMGSISYSIVVVAMFLLALF